PPAARPRVARGRRPRRRDRIGRRDPRTRASPAQARPLRAAGLVLLVAVLGTGCVSRSQAAEPVQLQIRHSAFTPAAFAVRAGTTVRIVVRNTDLIDHELIVGDQATQDRHEHGTETHHDGSVAGEVSVPAGSTVTTTYRFDRPGRLLYGCHLPGHWAYGMRGTIEIRA